MKVAHISPTYFGVRSVIGGGERYAYELAKAMANKVQVAFVSFADLPATYMDGNLHVARIGKDSWHGDPVVGCFSPRFLRWMAWADVIHCHQVHTVTTDIPLLLGKILRKPVFVTDLGGGQRFALSYHMPILRWASAFLLISEYSRSVWQRAGRNRLPSRLEVIYGGVDCTRFVPNQAKKTKKVLYVGRILPHKGVDYLIKAITQEMQLEVVGPVYDQRYYGYLRELSVGKSVRFSSSVSDEELAQKYQEASVTVLPSVYDTCYGDHTEVPELLGLTALESMACATPVIGTAVGALPEIIDEGVTGFLVPPNDPESLREKIDILLTNSDLVIKMGEKARRKVLEKFTWDTVANACLRAYQAAS